MIDLREPQFHTGRATCRSRLASDDDLVAVGFKISRQNVAEIFFSAAGNGAIVIGEVKVGNAQSNAC